jgi:hypothetical protein
MNRTYDMAKAKARALAAAGVPPTASPQVQAAQ